MTSPPSSLPPVRRLDQGDLVNPTGFRDPLAVRFDRAANVLVTRAIARQGSWTQTYVPSPAAEYGDLDKGGLTHHERAFQQACYYHRLIYRHGVPYYVYDDAGLRSENPNPERTHALKLRWGRVQARGRLLEVRAIRAGEASLYATARYT